MKVAVVTGTRAEYGLLHPLLVRLRDDSRFELALVVTGSHLSATHGETWREIAADGFAIDERVDLGIRGDSVADVREAIASSIVGIGDALTRLSPDVLVLLGDRYEILGAAIAAHVARIPIAHIHGGEVTQGAIDEAFRHAITKMSSLHLTSTEEYRARVIQLGEDPASVFAVGALGVDNVLAVEPLTRVEVEERVEFGLKSPWALATYHPVTLEGDNGMGQLRAFLDALESRPDVRVLFTRPNADTGGDEVASSLEAFVAQHSDRAAMRASLGRVLYLSAMRHADVVIGNSSSGIIEAPALRVPVVDIGDRQLGRSRSAAVVHCEPAVAEIADALDEALSPEGRQRAATAPQIYGDGHAAERMVDVLAASREGRIDVKKRFHDIARRDAEDGGSP